MMLLPLTRERVTIIDNDDEWLTQWKWSYSGNGYAVRRCEGTSLSMHIAIMQHHGCWKPGCDVDHRNGCGLDNRKENLRVAQRGQNVGNSGLRRSNTSGVAGVRWHARDQRWRATIARKHLGSFRRLEDAIAARFAAEVEYYGDYRHNPLDLCPGWASFCAGCGVRLAELLPQDTVDWSFIDE